MSTQSVQVATAAAVVAKASKSVCIPSQPSADADAAMRYSAAKNLKEGIDYRRSIQRYKRALVEAALKESGGVQKLAAARLGISRVALAYHLQRAKELL